MKLVILESPLQGGTVFESRNKAYLDECIADSLRRGEAPFASHKLYPGALDDTKPDERRLGIAAGFAWRRHAAATVVYEDYGLTPGMLLGIEHAREAGHEIEFRKLSSNVVPLPSVERETFTPLQVHAQA